MLWAALTIGVGVSPFGFGVAWGGGVGSGVGKLDGGAAGPVLVSEL